MSAYRWHSGCPGPGVTQGQRWMNYQVILNSCAAIAAPKREGDGNGND